MVLNFKIYLTVEGPGTVTKNPNQSQYDPETPVTLIATPTGDATFSGWSGDASGTDLSIIVTSEADVDLYITATFVAGGGGGPTPPDPNIPYTFERGIENFTTYHQIDPEGNITITYSRVTWTTANRNVAASVYKNYGTGYITDFQQRITIYLSVHPQNGAVGVWGISNGNFTLQTMINKADGISLFWSSDEHKLILRDITANVHDTSITLNLSTIYYLTINRQRAVTSVYIYTDSDRKLMIDSISVTGNPQPYNTLIAYHSYNNNSFSATTTGYVEMFENLRAVSTAWLTFGNTLLGIQKQTITR